MEREAIGPVEDRFDDVARRWQARRQQQGGHRRGVLEGQALQSDLLGLALGQETRSPVAQWRPRRCIVTAVCAEDEDSGARH